MKKMMELGWVCVPMVVEAYGAWGTEAMESFYLLASRLATTPGAHGAVGAALAAPTFGPKMGVSNMWACLML